MLVHRRVTPSIKFADTHVYTWVERGAVRVKSLAQEHNIMSLFYGGGGGGEGVLRVHAPFLFLEIQFDQDTEDLLKNQIYFISV